MKKSHMTILALITLFTLCFGFCTLAFGLSEDELKYCENIGNVAYEIMEYRQKNVPLNIIMEDINNLESFASIRTTAVKLATIAFEKPLASSDNEKQMYAMGLKHAAYSTCIEVVSESRR